MLQGCSINIRTPLRICLLWFLQIRVAVLRTHYNGFYFSRNQNLHSLYIVFQASNLLERMVWEYPQQSLHQDVLFNLNTIYELETSRALQKKHKLLDLVSKHKGDGFFTQCLKLTQTTAVHVKNSCRASVESKSHILVSIREN